MDFPLHLTRIIIYGVFTFVFAILITRRYISALHFLGIKKQIRTEASLGTGKAKKFHKLHAHKEGTPTMGGGMILGVVAIMVLVSIFLRLGNEFIGLDISNDLWSRSETWLTLFTLATLGVLGGIDDYLNVK